MTSMQADRESLGPSVPHGAPTVVDPYETATTALAVVAVLVVGFDQLILGAIPITLLLGMAFLPLLWPIPRRYPYARLITALVLLSIVSGLILGIATSVDHQIDTHNRIAACAQLLGGLVAIVLVLWARTRLPLYAVVALYGLGGLVGAAATGQFDWKFNLAIPTTFLVLGVLERFGNRLVTTVVIIALGATGIVTDGRSFMGFCLLAGMLTLIQMPPRRSDGRTNRWFPAVVMAGLCLSIYLIASSLLTGGYLGQTLQERSSAQVEATGSLIAGGRPEWAATRELIRLRPAGYGAGAVPDINDLAAGRAGLSSINIDTGGYVNNYMFGGQFRLHSVASDLWVSFGWVGVALAATLLFALVRSLSTLMSERRAPTSVIFGCVLAVWYLFFGPIYSNWTDICFAVGLALLARGTTSPDPDRAGGTA